MPLLNDANAVLLGTNPVDAVYLGDVQVWPSGPELPFTDSLRLICDAERDPGLSGPTSAGGFTLFYDPPPVLRAFFIFASSSQVDLDGKPISSIATTPWQTKVAGISDSVSGATLPGAFTQYQSNGLTYADFTSFSLDLPDFFVSGREYVFGIYDSADAPSIWEGRYLKKWTSDFAPTIGVGEMYKISFEGSALHFNSNDQDLDGNLGAWTTLEAVVESAEVSETECVFEMTNLSSTEVWSSRFSTTIDSPSGRLRMRFEDSTPAWDDVEVFCRVRLER